MIPQCYSSTFGSTLIEKGRSDHHQYEFRRHDKFGLCLFLDDVLQSAESDQAVYHRKLVKAALEENSSPKDILIIGGAGGGVLHQLYSATDLRYSQVVIVDVDEKLFNLAPRFMRTWNKNEFQNPNVETVFENGRDYLLKIDKTFDMVILDVGDPLPHTLSNDIYTPSVLNDIGRILRLGGVVSFHTAPEYTWNHIFVTESLQGKCMLRKMSHYLTDIPSFEYPWMFNTLKKHSL